MHIAFVIGSLRRGSYSRKVAEAARELVPDGVTTSVIEIGDLPLYNEDLDDDPPAAWTSFRSAVVAVDGVVFVTPEYNRSVPGVLKNAVDVGSRPEGDSVWAGVPAGVISVTPYRMGAFGANHALRQAFVFLDMPALQQPEVYIGDVKAVLDDAGRVSDDGARELLQQFMDAFAGWTRLHTAS